MIPEIDSVYVCIHSVKGIGVGELCSVIRVTELYDAEYYDLNYRYAITLHNSNLEFILYLIDFSRCFTSISDWREIQLEVLKL